MIYMEDRHWKIVSEILSRYPYTFYAFGSRAKGDHKRLSDLDLYSPDPIPSNAWGNLTEEFEESDLPFKVDVLLRKDTRDDFLKLIEKDFVLVQKAPSP